MLPVGFEPTISAKRVKTVDALDGAATVVSFSCVPRCRITTLKPENENFNPTRGRPLWSSGQSSWLQIRRPDFNSRHYQKNVVGLERGPLSLVSTTEELLDKKVAAPV
jgi:hypothetical protein